VARQIDDIREWIQPRKAESGYSEEPERMLALFYVNMKVRVSRAAIGFTHAFLSVRV
jgi:hypothetical protein